MEVAGLYLPLVFAAGLVSFISPCVLPLVPGYLSTVSGISFDRIAAGEAGVRRRVAASSGLFFAGFLAVFLALGASASALGALLLANRILLNRIAGAVIVLFGLSLLFGAGPLGGLGARWSGLVQRLARRRGGPIALGAAFAVCWTPCVGPILGAILTLAAASGSPVTGILLMLVYGLGLATPFLLIGFGFTWTLGAFKYVQRHYGAIQAVAGVLLIGMGAVLATGYLYVLNAYAQRALTALGLDWWTSL